MAIIDVVKYQGSDEEFAWKFPSENLRLGSQLVVKTSQYAFFVKGGEILDDFNEGTYTLKTGNIPLLGKIINIPFGGNTPFQAEVWFINLISKLDNKWGTPNPIQLEDPKYQIVVPVRAFGQFGMSIEDPRKFLQSLVGNMNDFSSSKVVEYFNGKLISTITSSIGKKMIIEGVSVLQINAILDELSGFCKEKISEEFSNYGVKIENFYIMSINVPESDPSVIKLKESKDLATKVNIVGKDVYQMDRTFDTLDKAAQNEGTMGNTMGAGMGLGLGFGMGNQMGNMTNNMNVGQNNLSQQNIQSSPPQSPPPPPTLNQYFVLINNEQNGPHTIDNIRILINKGEVTKETLIWKEGMEGWTNIMEQNDLKSIFGSIPPPPPIPSPTK
jgi:membrane protease subunit (stomatin/prohibitin family)|tara:strand:- start:460 stop:1614 length:1155 start_codon:yes stop_codon:yes gene_type:complete